VYRCTPQSSNKETPYSLTYGTVAMIPVEIRVLTLCQQLTNLTMNNETLAANLDFISELRDKARIRDKAGKL